MQRDFHYYCIAVLAKEAGYSDSDSETISYASQYVDDATESEPISVGDIQFEPTRTAVIGLSSFSWGAQKRIYLPFHFLPSGPIKTGGDSYIVEAGGPLAHKLLDHALAEPNDEMRPYRIGVALHPFADTWTHQGFSGLDGIENEVEALRLHDGKGSTDDGDRWKSAVWKNLLDPIVPHIGHAQAHHCPDLPYLTWQCERPNMRDPSRWEQPRSNTANCLQAAQVIFSKLAKANGKSDGDIASAWKGLVPRLLKLFSNRSDDVDERCDAWLEEFEFIKKYDHLAWRIDALGEHQEINWDGLARGQLVPKRFPMKDHFWTSSWVRFHRAALAQRYYVLWHVLPTAHDPPTMKS